MPFGVVYLMFCLSHSRTLKEDCKMSCDDLTHLSVCFRLSQCFLCVWRSHQILYVCCSSQCSGCSLQQAHMCGYSTSGTQVRVHITCSPCYVSFECFWSLTSSLQPIGLWLMNIRDFWHFCYRQPQATMSVWFVVDTPICGFSNPLCKDALKTLLQLLPQFGHKSSCAHIHWRTSWGSFPFCCELLLS